MSYVPRPSALPSYIRPVVGDPVLIVPQAYFPRAVDPQAAVPRAAPRLVLSVRTSTEAARGSLRDAVGALGNASRSPCTVDSSDVDRWPDGGGPRPSAAAAFSVAANRPWPERGAQRTPASARDAAYAALAAYARALRSDGVLLPAALVTLGAAVDEAAAAEGAGLLPPALLAAVQQDATQCCRTVFAAALPAARSAFGPGGLAAV
jgi:hypothetical protein